MSLLLCLLLLPSCCYSLLPNAQSFFQHVVRIIFLKLKSDLVNILTKIFQWGLKSKVLRKISPSFLWSAPCNLFRIWHCIIPFYSEWPISDSLQVPYSHQLAFEQVLSSAWDAYLLPLCSSNTSILLWLIIQLST